MDKKQQVGDSKKHEFIKDVHYYIEHDKVIFTEQYHLQRGQCCNNNCRHCPYKKDKNNDTRTTRE